MAPPILTESAIRKHRPFVLFWFARIFGSVALQMQVVAVGWQMYALTGSALDLGLVGLAQFVPSAALLLLAGHAADRHDRRLIVRLCQVAEGLCAAALMLGTYQEWLSREMIFLIVFVLGSARAFEMPTTQALLPGLIPPALLPRAVAASASAMQTASIGGPALGGLLYAVSPTFVYFICFVLFISASICVSLIRIERVPPAREPVSAAMLFAGIDFIRRNPVILGAISLDLFAVLLGGATALLPIYARDIFQTGSWGLGILRAAPAFGALLMALALARWPLGRRAGVKMFAGVASFGLATVVFGLSESFTLSLAALFVLGASDMVSVVVRQTLVQINTPDAMRGRVAAVNSLFIGTSNQLGEFESGLLANFVGAKASVVIGGLGTLAIVGMWMALFPRLRAVDRLDRQSG
ncbi:MAG TPA: MFS transporter [Pseudorhodoplanes sp.]|jgi:MFS family permease|nr:MFS transporter [Pseudorhodoplanes sp.]